MAFFIKDKLVSIQTSSWQNECESALAKFDTTCYNVFQSD